MEVSNTIAHGLVTRSPEMVSEWLPQKIADVWEHRPKGMRSKDVEAKLKISRGTFWNWRTSNDNPKNNVLPDYDKLEALVATVGGQFILELVPPGEDARELVPLDPTTATIAREIVALSPEDRAWVLRLVRVWAGLGQSFPILKLMVTTAEDQKEVGVQ